MTTKDAPTIAGDGDGLLAMEPPRSAEEAVTDALRQAIREGVLAPGQRLAQADLAEQLGVSRIPLRDALRRLEAEALVHIDGRRGARVAELPKADIEEIYEMRIELEGRCVKLAVANLSKEDAEDLVALGEAMESKATNPSEGLAARRAFYAALYGYAGRPRMRRVILQLRDNVARYHLLTNRELSKKAHSHLRDSILAGDAKTAGKVLKEHLEEARDDLLARIDEPETAAS
jgi:DNA-binding GntR family transcriptional regulator